MAREAIREYDRIRIVLEQIYTYGYFSREDFESIGSAGQAAYDKELQRLQSLFPNHVLQAWTGDRRRYFYIKRDYFSNRAPWLTASYFLRGLKPERLRLVLLALSGAPQKQGDLQRTADGLPSEAEVDLTSTLRRQLTRLVELGYLQKRRSLYSPSLDPLSTLTESELAGLYYLTEFFARSGFPRTPGEFLRRSLLRERYFRGASQLPEAFLFRENCCRSIFDEEMVCTLAEACVNRRSVELSHRKTWRRVDPLALRVDARMGRWYLLCVDAGTGTALRLRLRDIRKLKVQGPRHTSEHGIREAHAQLSHTYLSTTDRPPVLVEARLLEPQDSPVMLQFQREMFCGEVQKRPDGVYFSAFVRDPTELKPLLRSYFPYLNIMPGVHGLDQELHAELTRMANQYGTIS